MIKNKIWVCPKHTESSQPGAGCSSCNSLVNINKGIPVIWSDAAF